MKFKSLGVLFIAFLFSHIMAHAVLPEFWSTADIGSPRNPGSAEYNQESSSFIVKGAGVDIWNTSDQFRFVYQEWNGDGEWVMQLESLFNTNSWAKAGIMLREDSSSQARHAMLVGTPGNGIAFQRRKSVNGSSLNNNRPASLPTWLKLVRRGNQIDAHISEDGINWNWWISDVIDLPSNILVGIAVTSHRPEMLTTAKINAFTSQIPLNPSFPNGWSNADLGGPLNLTGFSSYNPLTGMHTLRASGADLWGAMDQGRYISYPWTGNGVLVTKVESLKNTNPWAKAGLMIRENRQTGSKHASLYVTPGNGVAFQRRTATDNQTINTSKAGPTTPIWLKLERWGDRFDAFTSSDGLFWKFFASDTVQMSNNVEIGLVATSHQPNLLTEAVFRNFDYFNTGLPGSLLGEYFKGRDFSTLLYQRIDGPVNFNWGTGTPDASVPKDNFSARWTGTLTPDVTQTYTLYTLSDDGIRLWIDNQLIINNWTLHGVTENSGTVSLNSGQAHDIKLEYFEATGNATARLLWSASDRAKTPIPAAFLRPSYYPDSDGDGLADCVDTFPNDYYNQLTPLITILEGNNQIASPGALNINPFEVAIWNNSSDEPYKNAPVSFYIDTDGGYLFSNPSNAPYRSINLKTDEEGTARVYFRQPAESNANSRIVATAKDASVTFTTSNQILPIPEKFAASAISSSQIALHWKGENNPNYTYQIERKDDNSDYVIIATVVDGLSYLDANLAPNTHYYYRLRLLGGEASDPISAQTNESGAFDTFPTEGLKLWLRADAGIFTTGQIDFWYDQSGLGNNAYQDNEEKRPSLQLHGINNLPSVEFDGIARYFQLPNILAGTDQGEAFMVTQLNTSEQPFYGLAHLGLGYATAYTASGSFYNDFGSSDLTEYTGPGLTILEQPHLFNTYKKSDGAIASLFNNKEYQTSVDAESEFRSDPLLGSDYFEEHYSGLISEVVIYDRALSSREREAVVNYIKNKYAVNVFIKPAIETVFARAISSTEADVTWKTSGEVDANCTIVIERKDGEGEYTLVASLSSENSFHDTTLAANTAYTYRIKITGSWGESNYGISNTDVTPANINKPTGVGLKLWLRSTAGINSADAVTLWKDQSGNNNNAYQLNPILAPSVLPNAKNGLPAVNFNGTNRYLDLPDLMQNANSAEVYAVVRLYNRDNDFNTLFKFGAGQGTRYGNKIPSLDDFGTTEPTVGANIAPGLVNEYHLYQTSLSIDGIWRNYINGFMQSKRLEQTAVWASNPSIGNAEGEPTNSSWPGEIMEILIYDRELNADEKNAMYLYLNHRYNTAFNLPAIDEIDWDMDGLSDEWELSHFKNLNQNSSGDFDLDSISNATEYKLKSSPILKDTDSDGLPDGWEFANSLDLLIDDSDDDPDGDSQTNRTEYINQTPPNDYYNGNIAYVVWLNSENKLSNENTLSALITDGNGKPLVNAPVIFNSEAGGHTVSASPLDVGSEQVEIRTDFNGIAKVYLLERISR